jgi:hypothetical protein
MLDALVKMTAHAMPLSKAISNIHQLKACTSCPCLERLPLLIQAIPGQVWLILDAGGGTVDIAMHRIEQSSTPGRSQLSEVLRAACLLQVRKVWGGKMGRRWFHSNNPGNWAGTAMACE